MVEQAISNLCIISDKKNCPARYNILDRTVENDEGDIWKDKLFNRKYRYLCYSKEIDSSQANQVITDLALISSKDPVPDGYTCITTTADTQEQALQKQVLCIRYTARSTTNAAIIDICLFKDNSYRERMYTLVGEVNGINLTYKIASLPRVATRPAPLPPSPIPAQPTTVQNHINSQHTYDSLQRQPSKPMTGIEGVPFKLNERFTKSSTSSSQSSALDITVRNIAEVTRLTNYDFSQEKVVVGSAS